MKAFLFATFLLVSLAPFPVAQGNHHGTMEIDSGLEQRSNVSEDGYQTIDKDGDIDKRSEQGMDSVHDVEEDMTLHGGSHSEDLADADPRQVSAMTADVCKFPTDLKESELDCTTYPSKVVCVQTCIFGYKLEGTDEIRRKMECKNDENRWTPVPEFESCKPFVDCGVTIRPGGAYECRKNFLHKGNDCAISCSQYKDLDAVPVANYECDIHGNWTPNLPFCARPGSGLKLVPPPHGPRKISEL